MLKHISWDDSGAASTSTLMVLTPIRLARVLGIPAGFHAVLDQIRMTPHGVVGPWQFVNDLAGFFDEGDHLTPRGAAGLQSNYQIDNDVETVNGTQEGFGFWWPVLSVEEYPQTKSMRWHLMKNLVIGKGAGNAEADIVLDFHFETPDMWWDRWLTWDDVKQVRFQRSAGKEFYKPGLTAADNIKMRRKVVVGEP